MIARRKRNRRESIGAASGAADASCSRKLQGATRARARSGGPVCIGFMIVSATRSARFGTPTANVPAARRKATIDLRSLSGQKMWPVCANAVTKPLIDGANMVLRTTTSLKSTSLFWAAISTSYEAK